MLISIACLSGCRIDGPRHVTGSCVDQTLRVAGPPVQTRAMAVFRSAWVDQCPGRVFSYLAMDPADALARFTQGDVDMAGVHSPLTPDERQRAAPRCDGSPVWHLPVLFRAVSLPYNVPGVGNLVLTGRLVAKIFAGDIRAWNDREIVAVNSGTTLPEVPVVPVIPDGSALVDEDFEAYLRAVRGDGAATAPAGAVRAPNAETAIQTVAQTPGAITYAAFDAGAPPLPSALIDSGQGPVALTAESAMRAVDAAEFAETGNDLSLAIDTLYRTRQPGGYPLIGVSYEVVCSRGYDLRTLAAVKSFLEVAATIDQTAILRAGYLPLPQFLKGRVLDVAESLE